MSAYNNGETPMDVDEVVPTNVVEESPNYMDIDGETPFTEELENRIYSYYETLDGRIYLSDGITPITVDDYSNLPDDLMAEINLLNSEGRQQVNSIIANEINRFQRNLPQIRLLGGKSKRNIKNIKKKRTIKKRTIKKN